VTDGVKTHLLYVTRCSYPCFLSNTLILGSKFGFVLVSFLRHRPLALAPAMVGLLFALFLPFCLTKSLLSGFTGLSLSVGNSIKSFLYLDANPVMTSCGHIFQVPPGWADGGRWWPGSWALPLSQCISVVLLSGCPAK